MSDEQTPDWALNKAIATLNEAAESLYCGGGGSLWRETDKAHHAVIAFARYIAEHEEAPVDPLEALLTNEARNLARQWCGPKGITDTAFCQALIALKRGRELATQPTDEVQP